MIQMGCLLPGRDSVGRHYPVCLQLSFTPAEWSSRLLGQAESWYQQLGRLGLHAVRNSYSASQLDEMLMTIPAPQPVEPQKRSDILDVIGYDDSGNFTGQLFTMLFDPAGGARPGRHGLYPPMFE